MKMVIVNGKWFSNEKQYPETSGNEKLYFDKFIALMKEEKEIIFKKIREVEERALDKVIMEIRNYKFGDSQAKMKLLF